jgi:hypothetical protein
MADVAEARAGAEVVAAVQVEAATVTAVAAMAAVATVTEGVKRAADVAD